MRYQKRELRFSEGLTVYLLAIVVNLALQFALSVVAMIGGFFSVGGLLESDYFNLAVMLLLQVGFLSVPVVYFACKKKVYPVLTAPLEKPHPSVAFSVLLPVVSILCFYLPAAYFSALLEKIGYNFSAGVSLDTPGKFVLGIFVMVIAAPCVEELIFRGFLLSSLRKRFHPYVAALLCAAAFSLMHMNPEQTVYQFCLGYVCGLAAIKCGNLLPAIVAHAGNNLIAVLLDIPAVGKVFETIIGALTHTPALAAVSTIGLFAIGAAIVFGLCLAMEKLTNNRKKVAPMPSAYEPTAENENPFAERTERESRSIGAETENVPTPSAQGVKTEKKKQSFGAIALFVAGLGLCVLMWITVFVSSMISLDDILPTDPVPEQTVTQQIDI